MQLKRFTAPTMQKALAQIRETLGEDALIVYEKAEKDFVEVIAQVETKTPDLQEISKEVNQSSSSLDILLKSQQKKQTEVALMTQGAPTIQSDPLPSGQELMSALDNHIDVSQSQSNAQRSPSPATTDRKWLLEKPDLDELKHEIESLKELVQIQLANFSFKEIKLEAPVQAFVLRKCIEIGLDISISQWLSSKINHINDLKIGWAQAKEILVNNFLVQEMKISQFKGVYCFWGSPGIGKTTSVIQMASHIRIHSKDKPLILIGLNQARLGSQETLKHYAKLLNAEFHMPLSLDELKSIIKESPSNSVILLETASNTFCEDPDFSQYLSSLEDHHDFQIIGAHLQRNFYDRKELTSNKGTCSFILTHLDECESLGGAFSIMLKMRIPLSFGIQGDDIPNGLIPFSEQNISSFFNEQLFSQNKTVNEDVLAWHCMKTP